MRAGDGSIPGSQVLGLSEDDVAPWDENDINATTEISSRTG